MKEKIRVEPKGLGDLIHTITFVTGIEKVTKTITESIGIKDCGCNKRKEQLNKLFPFNNEYSNSK